MLRLRIHKNILSENYFYVSWKDTEVLINYTIFLSLSKELNKNWLKKIFNFFNLYKNIYPLY